ncbi:MAG: tryptophan synthase subunit alpha [Promethearchaeota archaeon]
MSSVSRISGAFEACKERGEAAFVPFVVLGDPTPDVSLKIVEAIEPHADILEVGIPFSDPLADGPTIQAANQRAFASGVNTDVAFDLISKVRSITDKPIVILTYFNVVLNRRGNPATGVDRFFYDMRRSGADGVIIADLPVEEVGFVAEAARREGRDLVFLVSPLTSSDRAVRIMAHASGYLYLVSLLGVTGARDSLSRVVFECLKRLSSFKVLPVAVGFGISKPEHVEAVASAGADGVIVGSAIVDLVARFREDVPTMLERVASLARSLKAATKRPRGLPLSGNSAVEGRASPTPSPKR